MSDLTGQLQGTYGGKISIGHLAYTEVRWWGEMTRATPDGRRNGEYLTQGLTPSRLKRIPNMTDVVYSLSNLDPSIFGANTVTNLMLPYGKLNADTLEAVLRAISHTAAQSLQLNYADKAQLLDAQKHPENYPDLIVRVTGFSAKFTSLSPEWQQEILTRNFYEN
jgi:formate C-acetyltransferase